MEVVVMAKAFLAENGFKKCNCCLRILPANTDYFNKKNDTKEKL